MTTIGNNIPSAAQHRVSSELGKATRALQMGMNELVERFDTRVGEKLFRSFGLTVSLQGSDAGARFLNDHAGTIAQMPAAQRSAFSSLMSDARDVDALKNEAARLSQLQSLQALFANV
jgi:hypothetical protein